MTRTTWRTFLTMLTVFVTSITCGCSVLLIKSGVSGPEALSNYTTRAQINDQFGEADDTRTCPDGRVVESRWIRQQLKPPAAPPPKPPTGMADAALQGAVQGAAVTVGLYLAVLDIALADIPGTALAAYISEKRKLHYAFVYDEADQVLYLYDLSASPPAQFDQATEPLDYLLTSQLVDGKCETWTACITDFAQEVRRRAACLEYTLSNDQEQVLERLFAMGEGVDSGRISCEDGLVEIREQRYYLRLHQLRQD